jgi:hypothetical protein
VANTSFYNKHLALCLNCLNDPRGLAAAALLPQARLLSGNGSADACQRGAYSRPSLEGRGLRLRQAEIKQTVRKLAWRQR